MRRFTITIFMVAVLLGIGYPGVSVAEDPAALQMTEQSSMRVEGSSTVHDWHCEDIVLNGAIEIPADVLSAAVEDLSALAQWLSEYPEAAGTTLTIPVKKMHCYKSGMDPKMHTALKAEKHPEIQYELSRVEVAATPESEGDTLELKTEGELTVAGKTRTIEMPVSVKKAGPQKLMVKGSKKMKMSDFDVERPSAMFGMIKAYDDITVTFTVYAQATSGGGM